MLVLAVLLAVSAGLLMAFQSPVNTTLSRYIGNFEATAVSFSGATVLLFIAVLLVGNGDFAGLKDCEPWNFFGGLYGVCVVSLITFAVPVLGLALTLITMIFGQLIMGVVIDQWGLLESDMIPVGPMRIAGCAVFAVGMMLVFIGKRGIESPSSADKKKSSAKMIVLSVLSFICGTFSSLQSPTNVVLSEKIGLIEAAFVSFFVGAVTSILIICILRLTGVVKKTPQMTGFKGGNIKGWMLTGGVFGAVAIGLNIYTTPILGVTLLMAGLMFGQLGGGFVIDTFGLLRTQKVRLDLWRSLGLTVIAVGVALIAFAKGGA